MKSSVMSLAAWIYLGGPIIPFEVAENITARVDPGGVAETTYRTNRGAH
jgi:hypothetical protein